jgi:cytochrome P450
MVRRSLVGPHGRQSNGTVAALRDATSGALRSARPVRSVRGALQQLAITAPERLLDLDGVSAMGLVRRRWPVLRLGRKAVLVTRREDVLQVLEDPATFRPAYTTGLAAGFVLGQVGAEHERHRVALTEAVRPTDADALTRLTSQLATACVEDAGPGDLAVGADLVRPVYVELVARYLGVRAIDPERLVAWSRAIFQDIFLNRFGLDLIQDRGEAAVTEFRRAAARAVAERRELAPDARPDDVLDRLLATERDPGDTDGLDALEIEDALVGLTIGWFWHGSKAALLAVDGLLDRPDALERARCAAQDGDLPRLQTILWEVLRFRPVQVGLPRTCAREVTLADGTDHARTIPAGTAVVAGTHSAMWDEDAVPDPARFDTSRADGQYLVFGSGPHRCLGEGLMGGQLAALLAPLLAQDGLARAGRWRGRLRWAGPAVDDLRVRTGS